MVQLDPRTRARLGSLRRWLIVLGVAALAWAVFLFLTDGFVINLGSFRVSSRKPRTPLLIALAGFIGALVVSRRLGETHPWRELSAWAREVSTPVIAWIDTHAARSNVPTALPIACVITAAVVDLHQLLGAPPLWLDEEMIALNLRDRSFAELDGPLWLEQSAPYGWLAAQRAVLLTLGRSEVALRLLPTLFGVATYGAALWIARRWLTWPAGVAFVLLCALGAWLTHFRVEVKHYTADVFWALLLPALAVWASEAAMRDQRLRRMIVWWATAAAALWLANGAVFAAPAPVLFLLAATLYRDGARAAVTAAAWGVVWLASFSLHYLLSLRHTAYLRHYWAAEFPPEGAGWLGTLGWFAGRLDRIAADVAGSDAGAIFWALVALGFVVSARRGLAVVYGGVVLSGFVLAALRLVPLFDRFSLWMVPALYAGIALLLDHAVRSARDASRERHWLRGGWAMAVACAAIVLCLGILQRGVGRLHMERPTSKQGVDDRTAVRWLMSQRQQGDALLTTPLGLPAVWWYGDLSIAGDVAAGANPMYQVLHRRDDAGCALAAALKDHARVLVYVGFPDMPRGFDELLFNELSRIGTISAYREVTTRSRAAVVDLRTTGPEDPAFTNREPRQAMEGCVGIRRAVRR